MVIHHLGLVQFILLPILGNHILHVIITSIVVRDGSFEKCVVVFANSKYLGLIWGFPRGFCDNYIVPVRPIVWGIPQENSSERCHRELTTVMM